MHAARMARHCLGVGKSYACGRFLFDLCEKLTGPWIRAWQARVWLLLAESVLTCEQMYTGRGAGCRAGVPGLIKLL